MNFIKKAMKDTQEAVRSGSLKKIGSIGRGGSSREANHQQAGSQRRRSSYDTTFLHGHLFVEIVAARNLPDMESWLAKLVDNKDVTDAFVDVMIGNARVAKTSVILNNLNPEWNESYRIEVCHFTEEILFEVRDKDHAYAEYIGVVRVPTGAIILGTPVKGWFPIVSKSGATGELCISVEYVSVASIENSYEVDSYFKPTSGNHVMLYQDAHCPENMPQFYQMAILSGQDPGLTNYHPASCWADIRDAILGAEELICITGWAVWDKLHLLRGLQDDGKTLGEILIDKANSGVAVYVMVWSEKTSGEIVGEKGVMGTHDMETFHYFEQTPVCCALAPRELKCNEFTDYLQNEFASGMYTHHQKSVIVDAFNGQKKRLVAFVGGLDLTGGRWDTPDHPLYETLLNEHLGDFRNSNAKSVPEEEGPRQPWHDIHAKLSGPIAHDIFLNFYERWNSQGFQYGRLNPVDFNRIDVVSNDAGDWNVQLFRSITSDSAVFEPRRAKSLNSKKGRLVDASIGQAYVQMIRGAREFLYIENQYFMGSAFCWMHDSDVNCNHTIPAEIVEKVVQKIHTGQRFCAYIVIPMWPEGDPTSAPIQEILYWQTRTMEMMYARVGEALEAAGISGSSHPTDWLLFMCPGKREAPGDHLERLAPPSESFAKIFRETLRFPIYVHSKMMIVDDTYIIVGSANINQRSMAGTRDTEMAVGCWQPDMANQGDVRRFRLSLWTEHLKACEPVFLNPASIECVQTVKGMASYNWQVYLTGQPGSATPGQLLPYPLNVMPDGTLQCIQGVANFPDYPSSAKVMGKLSAVIPQKVTT